MAEHGEVLGLALLQAETQPGPSGFQFQIWTPDMLDAAGAGRRSALRPAAAVRRRGERFGWTTVDGRLACPTRPGTRPDAADPDRAGADAALRRWTGWHCGASPGGAAFLLVMAAVLIWVDRRCHIQAAASHGGQRRRAQRTGSARRWTRPVRRARCGPLVDALNRLLQRIRSASADRAPVHGRCRARTAHATGGHPRQCAGAGGGARSGRARSDCARSAGQRRSQYPTGRTAAWRWRARTSPCTTTSCASVDLADRGA